MYNCIELYRPQSIGTPSPFHLPNDSLTPWQFSKFSTHLPANANLFSFLILRGTGREILSYFHNTWPLGVEDTDALRYIWHHWLTLKSEKSFPYAGISSLWVRFRLLTQQTQSAANWLMAYLLESYEWKLMCFEKLLPEKTYCWVDKELIFLVNLIPFQKLHSKLNKE